MDISVTIYVIDLKSSVHVPKALPEGSVSQNFDIGFRLHFMSKKG